VSLGILGEIMCVFSDVFSIDDFAETHAQDLVSGLLRVFSSYRASDMHSFNTALFFGPPEQNYFSTHFRIIPRTFLNMRDFAPDPNFYQMLLGEPVSVVMPEDVVKRQNNTFVDWGSPIMLFQLHLYKHWGKMERKNGAALQKRCSRK